MSMLECCKEGNLKEVSKFLAGGVHIDEVMAQISKTNYIA
jgi:hypothetical protein